MSDPQASASAGGVLCLVEPHDDGTLPRAALECLSTATELARASESSVSVGILGLDSADVVQRLAEQGAQRAFVLASPAAQHTDGEIRLRAVSQLVRELAPTVILLPDSVDARDLAARLAAQLGAGLLSDCIALEWRDGHLQAQRYVCGGRAIRTLCWTHPPFLATLRPNAFACAPAVASRHAEVVRRAVEGLGRVRVLSRVGSASERVELGEARIVVAAGRGLGGQEHLVLIRDLADALGGAVGASRAIVDEGWIGHEAQVGQTGRTIAPDVYIACGIRGAIQHLAGMSSSKVVIAINRDPDAPIFKAADYAIVGDVHEIVPRLTALLRRQGEA